MDDDLVYVYAVTDAVAAEVAGCLTSSGIDGAPVRVVASGRLAAVVSTVGAERFGEEPLRSSLEDLGWVADVARAHHRVVQAVGRRHAVAPVRLTTIYHDDTTVRALLDENEARFSAVLDRIRGRTEWGVKAFAASPDEGPEPQGVTQAGPGAAYLARKRAVRDHVTERRRLVVDEVEELHRQLAAIAVASRRYRPQDPRLTGRSDEMVLNAAYLVDDRGSVRLQEFVDAQVARSVRLELTGPWVPYSFSGMETSAPVTAVQETP